MTHLVALQRAPLLEASWPDACRESTPEALAGDAFKAVQEWEKRGGLPAAMAAVRSGNSKDAVSAAQVLGTLAMIHGATEELGRDTTIMGALLQVCHVTCSFHVAATKKKTGKPGLSQQRRSELHSSDPRACWDDIA